MLKSSQTPCSLPSLRSLYRGYIAALPRSGVRFSSDATQWTECVKTYWCKKGLDTAWITRNRRIDRIQLALECEWSTQPDHQEADFRKLVYVKAIQKVFLFQTKKSGNPLQTVQKLTRLIKQCSISQAPQEQYLLISHTDDRGRDKLLEVVDGFLYSGGKLTSLPQIVLKIP